MAHPRQLYPVSECVSQKLIMPFSFTRLEKRSMCNPYSDLLKPIARSQAIHDPGPNMFWRR